MAVAQMRTSQNGVRFIRQWEGLELEAYRDVVGEWTIGYGYTRTYPEGFRLRGVVKAGDTITAEEAFELLRLSLRPRERTVTAMVSVPLSQNEFDALVSFVYNIGAGAFQHSTARRRLNNGDRQGAADALLMFNKGTVDGRKVEIRGLTRRRGAERALFLTPVAQRLAANENDPPDKPDHRESNACPAPDSEPWWAKLLTFIFGKG